jgi:hypothetical protein
MLAAVATLALSGSAFACDNTIHSGCWLDLPRAQRINDCKQTDWSLETNETFEKYTKLCKKVGVKIEIIYPNHENTDRGVH